MKEEGRIKLSSRKDSPPLYIYIRRLPSLANSRPWKVFGRDVVSMCWSKTFGWGVLMVSYRCIG